MPYTYEYPRPSVTVDCVVFGFDPDKVGIEVLLIERGGEPFQGHWALPGGFLDVKDDGDQGESLEDAARRELEEETGARVAYMEQLYTFGAPGRDPRGRVISVAYSVLVRTRDHMVKGNSDARQAKWFALENALNMKLAFDHNVCLKTAVDRLQAKVRYTPVGLGLLPESFSLYDLRRLYEALLGYSLDASNFRKRIEKLDFLVKVGQRARGESSIPLYRFDKEKYDQAYKYGLNLDFEKKGK